MDINYILTGKLSRVWGKFIFAAVVGVVFNAIYSIVDGIFVGQGTGASGLAGVNLAWPAVTIILGLGLLFGTGASSLISIEVGKGDKEQAEKIIATTLKYVFVFGCLLTLLGILFADPIVSFLGASSDTYGYTFDYFRVVYMMAIPYLLANTLTPLVRADGNPNLSMVMVGVGAVGNIILDWLFVIVFNWGTAGAALATGAGVFLSSTVGLWYFTKGPSHLKLRKEYFLFNSKILVDTLKIGFVSFMIQLSIGIVILIQNNIIYSYGTTDDIAIFCVSGYIISLYTQLCVGMSQGMQPLIGYHYGANKHKRMRHILYITLSCSSILGILALIALNYFGFNIIQLFGTEPHLLEITYQRVLIFCRGIPFIGIVFVMSAYYQALNKNIYANILSVGRGCVLQVLFSIILPPIIGVDGIFYAQCLSDTFSIFIVIGVLVFSYSQQKRTSDLSIS